MLGVAAALPDWIMILVHRRRPFAQQSGNLVRWHQLAAACLPRQTESPTCATAIRAAPRNSRTVARSSPVIHGPAAGSTRGMLFEALLPPADRRLQALLARDLAELLALGRVGHRREAEHLLAIL